MHMTSLSAIKVTDEVRAEVGLNHQLAQQVPLLAGAVGGDGARATLYLNGLTIDAESSAFSVFSLLKVWA